MLDLYAFYLISFLMIVCALLIFAQKKLIHAVVALTVVFVMAALFFMLISQTFIAVLMLIIFVGGLSTYLIVAVGTDEKKSSFIALPYFIIVAAVLFAVMALMINYLPMQSQASGPNFLSAAMSAFQSSYLTLYIIVVLLFSVAIGSTLIIKKFAKLIV